MRVSKIEPHVLGGPPADDAELVFDSIAEESEVINEVDSTQNDPVDASDAEDRSFKESLVRLADYLKNKQNQKKTKAAIAIKQYIYQRDQIINAECNKTLKI